MNEPLNVQEVPASYQVILDKTRVRKGYKQTEVGMIPEDWELRLFGDICRVNQGLQIAIEKRLKNPTQNSKKYITIQFLNNAKDVEYIDDYSPSVCCSESDVLMTRTGNTGIVVTGVDGVFHNNFFKINFDRSRLYKDYLTSYLSSSNTRKAILTKAGTSTIPDLNHHDFYSLPIPIPSMLEQRAIATAISDVDALLASQDKLIAKKRDIKQATMQQLLTGKQRLPGFTGDWELKRLEDICWYQEGPGVRNYQFMKQGVKLLNGTNIVNGKVALDTTNRYISEYEAFGVYSHFLVDDGDILIASSGVTIDKFHEKVAFASSEHLPLCMNTSTIRFKPNSAVLVDKYLYFFLQSDLFKEPIGKQATGSAQLNFGPAHLEKINLILPPTLAEQTAITNILSDMDTELTTLEQQRDKTRALKQGMMQELLTGRIRLMKKEYLNA